VGRALARHPLRAADALQLAAALVWSDGAGGETFVCLDEGLRPRPILTPNEPRLG
jgi:hypothetical protein